MNYKRVEYLLINNDNGTSVLLNDTEPGGTYYPPPRNWEESEVTLKRSLDNFGVITQISRELEFTKQGADFLRSAYLIRDIEADVDLIEYRFNPNTDVRYIYSQGKFDFSEYISYKTYVSIPFKSGGLNALLKSKGKEKFELERTLSLDGTEIDELIKQDVSLTSRDILLVSQLETSEEDSLTQSFRSIPPAPFIYFESHVGVPLTINYESDNMVAAQIKDQIIRSVLTQYEGLASMVFYLNNDITKNVNISFELSFTPVYKDIEFLENDAFFSVILETYNNENVLDVDLTKRRELFNVTGEANVINYFVASEPQTITFNETITLEAGESLSLQWYGGATADDFAAYSVDFKDVSCTLDINEDSVRSNSQTQAVLMKDAGEKITQIITGKKGKYISDFFTNGDFKLSALSLGLWIRQFYDKNIEISFDSFINNSKSLFLTGYTIDRIDGEEAIVHESIDYFFQDFVAVDLTEQVSEVVRSAFSEKAYTSMKSGYKKPSGDNLYEEAQGLDEPNILNTYDTPITRVDNVYDISSDYRADSYGKEFARRQSIETNPTDDTRYDKSIFVLDLKEGSGEALEERIWSDDFEQLPTGVYSPETITGLRLSPLNNYLRHGKFLRSFLSKFVSESITFSNSIGNELLTTQPTGGVERSENSSVLIDDLDYPLFVNEVVEFKSKVTFEINQQIYGRTQVGDRSVPNFFGKVRFINEFGNKEEGYILELSPNNEGNWKLLKKA
jgi:hypothetical protein